MADLALDWNGDLSLDETGDILTVSGSDELTQRVVRRALTNAYVAPTDGSRPSPADYVFDGKYGGNLRLYVDSLANAETLQAIENRLLDQISQETSSATNAQPSIDVTLSDGAIVINGNIALSNGDVVLIPQLEVS